MDPDYKYESDKDQRLVEDEIFSDLDELIAHLVFVDDMADLERRLTVAREALETLAKLGNEPNYGNSDGNIIALAALTQTAPKP